MFVRPLGLTRTTWSPVEPAARGYWADPHQDALYPEPDQDLGALRPVGQLWSTVADMARWTGVLCGSAPGVLPESVVALMHQPQVLRDAGTWESGWGHGLSLRRRRDRVFAGHSGAMPGFSAAVSVHRSSATGAVVLANATRGIDALSLADDLVEAVLDAGCADPDGTGPPARSAPPAYPAHAVRPTLCPPELTGILGSWWSWGEEYVFRWRDDALQAQVGERMSVFVREGAWRFRTSRGNNHGEVLTVIHGTAGEIVKLEWGGYAYTRRPYQRERDPELPRRPDDAPPP
jgi:hypothetical protein